MQVSKVITQWPFSFTDFLEDRRQIRKKPGLVVLRLVQLSNLRVARVFSNIFQHSAYIY